MRRLAVRLGILGTLVAFGYGIWTVALRLRADIQQAADFLARLEVVNQIHVDPLDTTRNRSGVSDARSRTIVMAQLAAEDTSWVARDLPQWARAIYTVDDVSAARHTARNKGREANAYLTYLVEQYDDLPDFMVFLHSHRDGPRAWHVDNEAYSNVISVLNLRLDFVERNGYANLRCRYAPGCLDGLVPFRTPPDPARTHEHRFPAAWAALMPGQPLPRVIGVPCCAQFAVSRAQVRARPRSDYERYHRWLMATPLPDDLSGRILEHLWHIIFGQDPVSYVASLPLTSSYSWMHSCPELQTCYCNVYGTCGGAKHIAESDEL